MLSKLSCFTALTLLLVEGCATPPQTPPPVMPQAPQASTAKPVTAVPSASPTPQPTVTMPPTPLPGNSSAPILLPPSGAPLPELVETLLPNEIMGTIQLELLPVKLIGEVARAAMSEKMLELVKDRTFTIEVYTATPFYTKVKQTTAKIGERFRLTDLPMNTALQIGLGDPELTYYRGPCEPDAVLAAKTQSFTLKGQPLALVTIKLYETSEVRTSYNSGSGCTLPIEYTQFGGKVFDDTNAPLDGVKISVRSMNASVPFAKETTSTGGRFEFNSAPTGVQIEMIAFKPGFTTRRRVEVLRSNKSSWDNKYDFGTDGSTSGSGSVNNSLSEKPEVISVSPDRNASDIDPTSKLILKFSEPMDKATVENTFSVRSYSNIKLTADTNTTLPLLPTFNGDSQISTITNTLLWNKNDFNISWNSDDTEITLAFKDGKQFPSDMDKTRLPSYQVAFHDSVGQNGQLIKDKSGIGRSNNHFKLTDGPFEETYKFAVKADIVPPKVDKLMFQQDEDSDPLGDAIQVHFNEAMRLPTKYRVIFGGMGNNPIQAPAGYSGMAKTTEREVAKNYTVKITRPDQTVRYQGSWFSLGGTASFGGSSVNYGTAPLNALWLLPPKNTSGADVPNLNVGKFAVPGIYWTDSIANGGGVGEYSLTLVKTDGTLQPVAASVHLADNLANNPAIAADLQRKLNQAVNFMGASAPALNPFVVTSAASPNSPMTISFNDTSGIYIGWQQTSLTPGNGTDVLPTFANSGMTYQDQKTLNMFTPGDSIQVTVADTVIDPAGNTLDTTQASGSGSVL